MEILRTLVGSIGLVLSVPITTALAALVVSRSRAHRHAGASTADAEPVVVDPPVRVATRQAQARLALAAEHRRARREARRQIKDDAWQPTKAERDFWGDDASE